MKKSIKILFTLVAFLTCTSLVTAQYSRSIHHNLSLSTGFEVTAQPLTSDSSEVITVQTIDSVHLRVILTKMNKLGDMVSDENVDLPLSFEISSKLAVAGIHEFGSVRTLALIDAGSTSTQQLFWVSYNMNTGALTAAYESPTLFKLGYIKTVFNGSQLIAYHVKNAGGLYRIAIDPLNLANGESEELVNATISNSTGATSYILTKKAGTVVLVGTDELVSYTGGHSVLTFYKRTAANTFSTVTTTEAISGISNTMLLTSGNQLLVITNNNRQLYSTNFTLINSVSNPGSLTSAELVEMNGVFHLFYNKNGVNKTIYKSFGSNLLLVDSLMLNNKMFFGYLVNKGSTFLGAGKIDQKGIEYTYSGNLFNTNSSGFVFDLASITSLRFEEYNHQFATQDLSNNLSLGNRTLLSGDDFPSVKYHDSVSVTFYTTDYYIGNTTGNEYKGFNGNDDIYKNLDLPGPYTATASYDQTIEAQYNRGFYVSKAMIIAHLDSVQNGSSSYIPPHGIRNWPAHGNTSIGQANLLAPFVDVDGNSIYEPLQGDYPQIYGVECFFSITHMNPNLPESNGIETHAFVYKVACESTSDFENVLFKKTFVYSRVHDFVSLHKFSYIDMDLGNFNDDYNGTHTELGLVYAYNGDLYDEPNSGRPGFLDHAAAYGVMQLKGAKLVDDTLDNQEGVLLNQCTNGYGFNDVIQDNEYFTMERSMIETGTSIYSGFQNAFTSAQAFTICNGTWLDGSPITYGGDFVNTTTIPSRYMYAYDSDTLNYGTFGVNPGFPSSEFNPLGNGSASNPTGDRRVISFAGSNQMVQGQMMEMDQAFVFVIDTTQAATTIDGITHVLFNKCDAIKKAFNKNGTACGQIFNPIDPTLSSPSIDQKTLQFYPNPTNGILTIAGLEENTIIRVYDLNGKLVLSETGTSSKINVDLTPLKGAVFIFQVETGGAIYQTRIVKH